MWRSARAQWLRLHEPRRLLAIVLLGIAGAAVVVWLVARGDLVGADARAYWGGVRVWLDGGDPYHPTGPFLPYVYAPWLLPLFLPWALLPWSVAWFVWRGLNVLLFLWTASWAYRQHPLATALILGCCSCRSSPRSTPATSRCCARWPSGPPSSWGRGWRGLWMSRPR